MRRLLIDRWQTVLLGEARWILHHMRDINLEVGSISFALSLERLLQESARVSFTPQEPSHACVNTQLSLWWASFLR